MVSNNTGGLFQLAVRLMMVRSDQNFDLLALTDSLGQLFQIQDDYRNLVSAPMSDAKG